MQGVNTVDWLTAQLPVASKYQVMTFSTQARAALPRHRGQVAGGGQSGATGRHERGIAQAHTRNGGTSLGKRLPGAGQPVHPHPINIFPDYRWTADPGHIAAKD